MSFFGELKRRNVYKVGVAYLALGWVVIQATDTLTPALNLPEWMLTAVTWIGIIGFPFALLFAWAFELTPEGLKRDEEVDRAEISTQKTGQKMNYLIIGLLSAAVCFFAYDKFVLTPDGGIAEPVAAVPMAASSTVPSAPESSITTPSGMESIAVLPFVNMSSDPEQEYFSDGISEELLNLLAKIQSLKVIARTSSFAFKGKHVGIKEIANTLGVEHVLEGSVRKAGNKVRITAQLIRAEDGTHLWSDTWDRELMDIFAIQDEIAGSVVEQLKVTLLGAAPRAQEADPEAYSLFLQARHLYNQFTPDSIQNAIALYEQALEIDPDYAAAWSWFAVARSHAAVLSTANVAPAREAANRALELSPDSADVHGVLGLIAAFDGDLAAAASHIQRALALEPTNVIALNAAVYLARNLRRYDEAVDIAKHVIARDPVNWATHTTLGITYFVSGRLDDAITSFHNVLRLTPGAMAAHIGIGLSLLQKGELDTALVEMEAESFEGLRLSGLAMVHNVRGQKAESDAALAGLIEKFGDRMPTQIAAALAVRGEADRAFEWLDKAARDKDPALTRLANPYAWMFDNLREDARWLPFLESIGMAPDQLAAIDFNVTLPD